MPSKFCYINKAKLNSCPDEYPIPRYYFYCYKTCQDQAKKGEDLHAKKIEKDDSVVYGYKNSYCKETCYKEYPKDVKDVFLSKTKLPEKNECKLVMGTIYTQWNFEKGTLRNMFGCTVLGYGYRVGECKHP